MGNHDYAHVQTEKELAKLEKRIAEIYKQAYDELDKTVKDYFEQFESRDKKMKARIGTVHNGKEWTEDDYQQWRLNQIGRGKRFEAMRDLMAERYTQANEVAISYVNDATPGIYSLNRNYAAYTIDIATGGALTMPNGKIDASWTLFDESTVKRLITEDPDLMPYYPKDKALNRKIDLDYGRKKITANVTSGIMQGKSIYAIADDLQKDIEGMNRRSAVRTARTAVTGAQNAGRIDSYHAAEKMGIKLQKEWLATLDSRTRHAHAMLDGQRRPTDKPFDVDGYKIRFPGDPQAKGYLVYNCRCTLIAAIDGVDTSDAQRRARDPETGESVLVSDMSYSEWEKWHMQKNPQAWETYKKKGKNLSADTKQFQEYKKILGSKIPNTVDGFQNLKYNEPEKWAFIKNVKHQTVAVNNAPCETTKKKYKEFFLKQGKKHSEEFFHVGYTENDVLQLRYDMASQFNMDNAVDIEILTDGATKFNIYMNLGITKKRRFRTCWLQDSEGSKPRIITAFRNNEG